MTLTRTGRTQTAAREGLLTWSPRRGLTAPDAPDSYGRVPTVGERLAVADSWLLREGRVRALGRHRERFLRACADSGGPSPRQLVDFWQDMTAALPRTGDWFPRVELGAESRELRLLLRPAPPLGTGVRLWAAGQSDPRTVPRRKGPDLDILARVRQRAATEGADEAVLVAPSGVILEGATTSLLWWEDDTLCLPSPQLPVLAGVTTALIQEHAQRTGIRVAHRERTLTDLADREVWLVNALHGIRPVTEWTGSTEPPIRAGHAMRAPEWRNWLEDLPEPLL
ncbi:aminotransferase class IV [Streptomyces graminilatus]|uniref:aminotransferase class IV n=1 Tax=Streptomyces graminilatus TaxID=1464070 RepID=UPI0006E1B339|nr:aminotransferase class IV [Streptomyces graminilatus]